MKPYYERDGITIYHGDCRDLLPGMSCDAIVSDPPYGVGVNYGPSVSDDPDSWKALMTAVVPMMRAAAPFVVIPSCRIQMLAWIYAKFPPDWLLCWYKGSPGTASHVGFNDWEPLLVYGKPPGPMHDYFYAAPTPHDNGHPCPKPPAYSHWLIHRAVPDGGSCIDPFMGSGTTLQSAQLLGRRAIGIEIEERYCEIAAKRLSQRVMFGVDT